MTEPTDRTPPALPALSLTDPASRWTPALKAEFLRVLAQTQRVARAAEAVGMSRQSAYALRARLRDTPFDLAWEAAVQTHYDALFAAALERALHGVEVPVYHKGELVGTRRHFDERLTCFLLSQANHHRRRRGRHEDEVRAIWWDRLDELVDKVACDAPLYDYDDDDEEEEAEFE